MFPLPPLEDDASLEHANHIFWSSLLGHVQAEVRAPVESVLDVGCHHGGLLERLAALLHPRRITGVEPSTASRERALFRLRKLSTTVAVLPSPLTHPDREFREMATRHYLAVCGLEGATTRYVLPELPGMTEEEIRRVREFNESRYDF